MNEQAPKAPHPRGLTIIMPVYNDWESMALLTRDIELAFIGSPMAIDIVAIDDCSTEPVPATIKSGPGLDGIQCIRLEANVGHQRAIAIGLMDVARRSELDLVAVMDSDGEDRPEELRALADRALADNGAFVAQRAERSEGALFRVFYSLYIRLFKLLTGQRINFGNFSLLRAEHVRRVINSQHIWNNFPAALIQSRIPVTYVPTRRGKRYAGESRMNFVGLVAHGLGAISVFSEAVFIRILIASTAILLLSVGLGSAALVMKFGMDRTFPNWATTVIGFALLMSIQAMMMPILMAFLLLSNRGVAQPLPRVHALALIAERRQLAGISAD